MDKVPPARRSENMRRIRAKHTGPELLVRKALREMGLGYRLHVRDLPGSPDIVMHGRHLAIFVHGCFWHQHPGCRRAYIPSTRAEWWEEKFKRNMARDAAAITALKMAGWRVVIIWECETGNPAQLQKRLAETMDGEGIMSVATALKAKLYVSRGTDAPWYKGWDLTEEERERFRRTSLASQAAKAKAMRGECDKPKYPIPIPRLDPLSLMPQLPRNGLRGLSLFSGCGGLDLGFDRAGYEHIASYDILPETEDVLGAARPEWTVFARDAGDVTQVGWTTYRGTVDVLHGGPPCQPFSHAGSRLGASDVRDMIPEFVRAVLEVRPCAFVCENVSGLASKKFREYVQLSILDALESHYRVQMFTLEAAHFGVPQRRKRVFFIGFQNKDAADRFCKPMPTHQCGDEATSHLPRTMGAREALGLSEVGMDGLAPTLRSGWTGPRHTTSVVNSATAMRDWDALQIWPNGVAKTREAASAFVAKHSHFRLSIPDCMILQGFPTNWPIKPPVYKALGLIGNSVAPPMGYAVAKAVAQALKAVETDANH